MQLINHIEIRDGIGYVRGTNIKAEMIARMFLGEGNSLEDVLEQYAITEADLHSAVSFYYDNRAELDARHAEALEWAKTNANSLEKFKAKIAARQSKSD